MRVIRRAGGVAALDTSARARVAAVAAPGTRGASLAAPTTHTTAAALQGATALAAAAATAAPAGATVTSTTPPASFEWSRLHEINLDDLRRTTLVSQDDPANTTTARAVHQPLVAGWERAGRTRTSPSLPAAAEGWKYYNACNATIFLRPPGAEPRTDDQMLQLARRVASLADGFIAEWNAMVSAAPQVHADLPPTVATPSTGGGGAAVASNISRAGKKARHFVSHGNKGKV